MSYTHPHQPYQRVFIQKTAQQGLSLASKQTPDFNVQNKVETKRSNQIASEYYQPQQPYPSDTKGVSNNYFA